MYFSIVNMKSLKVQIYLMLLAISKNTLVKTESSPKKNRAEKLLRFSFDNLTSDKENSFISVSSPLSTFPTMSAIQIMGIMVLASQPLSVPRGVALYQDHVPVALELVACSITSFVEGPWSIITLTYCKEWLTKD